MTQKTSGWRALFSRPQVYRLSQNLLGASRLYRRLVQNHIRTAPESSILDLGCGHAPILEYLPHNIRYVGIDLSPKYIRAAEEKYGSRGEFHCLAVEDISDAGLSGFDLVLGVGVLHHLDEHQVRSFFRLANKALSSSGRCLTVDPCLVVNQHFVARFLIRLDRGRNIRSPEAYAALAQTVFPRLDQSIIHNGLHVPYTHLILESRK